MTGLGSLRIAIDEVTAVGDARRRISRRAEAAGFTPEEVSRISLVVAELGTNLVKHAAQAEGMLIAQFFPGGDPSIQILSIDHGAGICEVGQALRDGVSSTDTGGTGLGAIRRASDRFDLYAHPIPENPSGRGRGSKSEGARSGCVVLSEIFHSGARSRGLTRAETPWIAGGIVINCPGEEVSGDGWGYAAEMGRINLYVCDGLGHGPSAATVVDAVAGAFPFVRAKSPGEMLAKFHEGLRSTRGGALFALRSDATEGKVACSGIGNIAATIYEGLVGTHLVSMNGIVGSGAFRSREFAYALGPRAVLILHSDGLSTKTDAAAYPGLLLRHPAVIAAVLYRDFQRGRDDATCVVLKQHRDVEYR